MLKFPILGFGVAAVLFFMATTTAGVYGFDAAGLNVWLALGLTLIFNPLRLDKKLFMVWGLCAGIAAAGAFIFPAKIWGVWLFAVFLAAGAILKAVESTHNKMNANSDSERAKEYGRMIILAAAYFNLSFITNTAHTDVQYDFASCFNYIEYIWENNFLFWQENPLLTRPSYSTYHPILHFLLAAGEMRLALAVEMVMRTAMGGTPSALTDGPNMQLAAEAAQICFCFYMLWYYFLVGKILRFFKLSPAAYLGGLAFICFFPAYNAIAGFFNNDCLLLPLQAGSIYYSLLYYRDGGRKNLAYVLLFATAAALTKLSGIIILPLIGAAIALRLWQQRKSSQRRNLLIEAIVFGGLLFAGLCIWPLYQHYFLNVGFDFVPPQEHLSLKNYSLWQRFNPLGALFYSQMFYNDFGINLWETMTKTALFGQWDFSMRGADIMGMITMLVRVYKILLFLAAAAAVYLAKKSIGAFVGKNDTDTQSRQTNEAALNGNTAGKSQQINRIAEKQKDCINSGLTLVLLAGIIAGQVIFGLKHPYMCNQDFRYVAIITLPIALILAQFLDKLPIKDTISKQDKSQRKQLWRLSACGAGVGLIAIFAFLSAFVWWRISF